MKNLIKLTSKYSFQQLKARSPLQCPCLKNEVKISKRFFNHISDKKRNIKELTERLLIIPLIDEILKNGKITETRNKKNGKYFKISLKINQKIFSVIIIEKQNNFYLVSCFIYKKYFYRK